ncbi:MAG: hypothetical protein N5P05_002095 [Chroococcopsis gigantea SAG 12.99]|nr:hypothetical protein [Chroococcopsis gigantea SAG 12.99]
MIRGTIIEILFDITQSMEITCELRQDDLLSTRLVLIDAEQVIAETQTQWQSGRERK